MEDGHGALEQLLRFALRCADEADGIALSHFSRAIAARRKGDSTLVTDADVEIEQLLRRRISDAHPDDSVLGEELGDDPGREDGRRRQWILDPIDGTHNFVRGIPVFATLIALVESEEPIVGVVSAPALHQRWYAARGTGAYTEVGGERRRLDVSAIARLEEAQICYSSLRGLEEAGLAEQVQRLASTTWRDRGFGDFWGHMLVAAGSAEAMIETGVAAWDMAAPAMIVREAGGAMTDLNGEPTYRGPDVLTSNGRIAEQVLDALRATPSSVRTKGPRVT
jgi:histidinol-phosphatase